jgi:AcrR family transcriptional regulator
MVRKRIEILKAAAARFRDRGFEAARMKEIALGVGLTPGALYHYFESKSDLLYFCQEVSVERLTAKACRAMRLREGWRGRLRALIREHALCMLDELHGAAAHIEFHALPAARLRRIIRKRDAYEAIVRRAIERGIGAGEFAPCDPKLAALAILGAVNWTARWYRPEGPLQPGEIADRFADYLVRGLLAEPGRPSVGLSGEGRR